MFLNFISYVSANHFIQIIKITVKELTYTTDLRLAHNKT